MSTPRERKRRLEAGLVLWQGLGDRKRAEVLAFAWGGLEVQCLSNHSIDAEEVTRILLRAVERVSGQVSIPKGAPFARPLSEGGMPEGVERMRLYPIVLA